MCVCVLSHVQLFAIPWTVALQAPLSTEFSRQEYWSVLPFPPPIMIMREMQIKTTMRRHLSPIQLFATPWTVAYQAPLSMEFSRQEYWSGLPFPSPWDLPDPGIEPRSPALQADTLPSEPPGKLETADETNVIDSANKRRPK